MAEQEVDVRRVGAEFLGAVGRGAVRTRGAVDRHPGPDELPVAVLVCSYGRAVELVVEVVLGVHLGERVEVEKLLEGAHRTARRFARVVPALEGDHEESAARELLCHCAPARPNRMAGLLSRIELRLSVVTPTTTPAAVLWDMDGTLVNTEPYWIAAETELIESFGGSWTHEEALQLVGSGLMNSAEIIRAKGVDLDPVVIVDRLTDRVLEQLRGVRDSVASGSPRAPHRAARAGHPDGSRHDVDRPDGPPHRRPSGLRRVRRRRLGR